MKNKLKLILLLFLFSIGAKQPANALTESQIITEIRVRIKDTFGGQRFTDTQLLNLANEAQRDVINNTWVCSKSTSITLSANATYYTLPTDTLAIQRVTVSNINLPEATLIKLDADNGNSPWETTTGALPQFYFQDYAQSNKVGFYPIPSTTTIAKIIYYAQAADLVAGTDIPFNAEARYYPYHDLLIFYSAYRVYLIEGEQDKATIYRQEYESRLQVMMQAIGKKPNYLPSVSGAAHGR